MQALVAAIFLIMAPLALAKDVDSQNPNNQSEVRKPAAKQQDSTQSPPIVVNVSSPRKSQEETENEAKERDQKSKNDKDLVEFTHQLANYTFFLFIATSVLVVATVGLLIAAFRQSRDTKRSADIAERAITELEGPFLYPVIVGNNFEEQFQFYIFYDHQTSGDWDSMPSVTFKIRNYGRTLALPRTIAVEFCHYTCMPDDPRVDFMADYAVQPIIGPDNESEEPLKKGVVQSINRSAFTSIASGNSRLFLYGEISFSDIFGNDYIQTFCLAYNYATKSFVPWGIKYNQRKRKNTKGV